MKPRKESTMCKGQMLWEGSHDWNLTSEQKRFLNFRFQFFLLNVIDSLADLKQCQDVMWYVNVHVLGGMCEKGINAPTFKIKTIWGWPYGCKNLIFCRRHNCKFKFWFDYQCYWSFDVWKIMYAWNRFENLWLKFYEDISCELHTCM